MPRVRRRRTAGPARVVRCATNFPLSRIYRNELRTDLNCMNVLFSFALLCDYQCAARGSVDKLSKVAFRVHVHVPSWATESERRRHRAVCPRARPSPPTPRSVHAHLCLAVFSCSHHRRHTPPLILLSLRYPLFHHSLTGSLSCTTRWCSQSYSTPWSVAGNVR